MPNWCSNYLIITGESKKIAKIKRIITAAQADTPDTGLFETLIGKKPGLTQEELEGGAWYEANTSYYGTKWDVSVNEIYHNLDAHDDRITFSCETAWAPPIAFLGHFCKMYGLEGEIQYEEPGCDFAGKTTIDTEGNIIEEEDYRYDEGIYVLQNDYFWENLESNMDYYAENNITPEEFASNYSFATDEDKEEIKKMYEAYLVENEITIEPQENE